MRASGSRGLSVLLLCYAVSAIALFLYTYTQVDLSMTLTEAGIWQSIQKAFQYIGYFERPLSTVLYALLIFVFFGLYFAALVMIRKRKATATDLRNIILTVTLILAFSYPAFSYDIFNYMFTAKTILVYGQNPYMVRPLDFTGVEPWLSFLRWTHLPSAYTPLWILMSLIPYVLGFSTFLLIMWNMKILLAVWYLAAAYFIYRILQKVRPDDALYGTAVFALNPLVLIESVASPHNDIVMAALSVLAVYLYLARRKLSAFFSLSASVAVKLMTVTLYPVFFTGANRKLALLAMSLSVAAGFFRKELLPWYLLWVMPFVALNPEIDEAVILGTGLSAGLLLRYAPVLYFGHYDDPVGLIRNLVFLLPVAAAVLVVFARLIRRRFS